jgi:hypothetical protein
MVVAEPAVPQQCLSMQAWCMLWCDMVSVVGHQCWNLNVPGCFLACRAGLRLQPRNSQREKRPSIGCLRVCVDLHELW